MEVFSSSIGSNHHLPGLGKRVIVWDTSGNEIVSIQGFRRKIHWFSTGRNNVATRNVLLQGIYPIQLI